MRTLLFGILLFASACHRPSRQLAASLSPTDPPSTVIAKQPDAPIADYRRYLKAGDELVALGNEPGWSLTINPSKNQLRFTALDGDSLSLPVPQPITDPNGSFRYAAEPADSAGRIGVLFRPDSCVDNMSGQRFDYRVEVSVRGKSYVGCGVSLRQVALLQDIWVLTEFGGRTIPVSGSRNELPRLEISLTEGRVTGTTGCNRLSGPVRADTRQIQFGPLATTRMACPGEVGRFEGDFLEALSQPLTYRVAEGKLTLLHDSKPIMTFKKVD